MRAASYQDERCPDCRDGLVGADEWEAWLSRRDDAELGWIAEHGSLDAFDTSAELAELLDERPAGEEEVDCAGCSGTGLRVRHGEYRRHHAA
ncbi:hypothetical protein [Cryptosporangium aurantiacum]|uniref:Uncharacterized protein n=1 Tax=Cryptosporangium aurantiacum TaxID=134849 RepID=A0A1M7RJB0_9ACTN|nr:hypothetical protein [Cryptosporangium aurantiacum]SHN46425.1 hypothetical protein SAMN05443668_115113 [Cryptosporangium aurantiacum]